MNVIIQEWYKKVYGVETWTHFSAHLTKKDVDIYNADEKETQYVKNMFIGRITDPEIIGRLPRSEFGTIFYNKTLFEKLEYDGAFQDQEIFNILQEIENKEYVNVNTLLRLIDIEQACISSLMFLIYYINSQDIDNFLNYFSEFSEKVMEEYKKKN